MLEKKPYLGPTQIQPRTQLHESILRRHVRTAIRTTPLDAFSPLVPLFENIGVATTVVDLKPAYMDGLSTAQRGDRWTTAHADNVPTILTGDFTTPVTYTTPLAHEEGHFALAALTGQENAGSQNPVETESFCWSQAEVLARILGLPYSRKYADIQFRISMTLGQIATDPHNPGLFAKLDGLIVEEIALRGFSEYAPRPVEIFNQQVALEG